MGELTVKRSAAAGGRAEKVILEGSATIAAAAELKRELLAALDEGTEVEVDLVSLEEIDLTGLQLLCAAHQSAQAKGKQFKVRDGGNERYRTVVEKAGFLRHVGCPRGGNLSSCIWVGGDTDG